VFQTLTTPAGMLGLFGGVAALIWAAVAYVALSHRESVIGSTLGARSLIWVVGLAPAIAALLEPRAVLSGNTLVDAPPLSGIALFGSQALTLIGLTLSVLIIASQGWPNTKRAHRQGRSLITAVLAIYASVAVSAAVGGHGGFDRQLFVLPIAVVALYVAPRPSMQELVTQLRLIFRIYIYGSLVALIIAPSWASVASSSLSRDYFGIGGQLSGLTPHPNALGAIAATALMFELVPNARKRTWPMHAAATITALLLAQSRTGLAAAVFGLLFLRSTYRSLRPMRWITAGALVAATVELVLSPRIASLTVDALTSNTDLQTINGRTKVWAYAYNQFLANPLVGFGPNLFDANGPNAAVGAFPLWAGQAHNQIFQTLGETGILGMVALVAFIVTLIATAAKQSRSLAGLSSALVAIMLARFISEAPLASIGGYDSSFALLFVLIAVVITPLADGSLATGTHAVDREPVRIVGRVGL
jgi:exopolysaccharide production protein ExoQ